MTYFKPAALQKFILKLLMEVFGNEDENSVLFIFTVMLRNTKSSCNVQVFYSFLMNHNFENKIAKERRNKFQLLLRLQTYSNTLIYQILEKYYLIVSLTFCSLILLRIK